MKKYHKNWIHPESGYAPYWANFLIHKSNMELMKNEWREEKPEENEDGLLWYSERPYDEII